MLSLMTDERTKTLENLRQYSKDALDRARARAINAARSHGATWREVAITLGVSESGVDRIKYVDSAYNRTRNLPTDPDADLDTDA